jgi:hypothetical protein
MLNKTIVLQVYFLANNGKVDCKGAMWQRDKVAKGQSGKVKGVESFKSQVFFD